VSTMAAAAQSTNSPDPQRLFVLGFVTRNLKDHKGLGIL